MLPVPTDRTSGRRSSSIGCRSIVGRRTSTYITSSTSCDPFKVSFKLQFSYWPLTFAETERNTRMKLIFEKILPVTNFHRIILKIKELFLKPTGINLR